MSHEAVKFLFPDPQYTAPTRTRNVSLVLDHLENEKHEGYGLSELARRINARPGEKVVFSISNSVSEEEQALFKYFQERWKKKKFDAIVAKASEVLKAHPSSVLAHFFYGVACKKIPGQEKYCVPALAAAVSINPNFLSGWQALLKHFMSLGGFFSKKAHDETILIVKVLLKLEPSYDNWCTLVGQIWDYVISNDFHQNRILSLLEPYLNCSCPKRQVVAASVVINVIKVKNKLLPKELSNQVLSSFQVLITQKDSEIFRMGLLHAALRYFNRTHDIRQICRLLKFIHVNDVLGWKLKSAKEFAYNLIYEMFRTLGEEALESIVILKKACGEDILCNDRYFLCNTVFNLTNSYVSLLDNARQGNLQSWGRLLYLKVLVQLKLYQEAYEQILVDLNCSVGSTAVEKALMEMLIDIFSHAMDLRLQMFTLKLGYKYLKMYGMNVNVLHCLCLVCISLKDFGTAREMLTRLMSAGALEEVIYLQALIEEDDDIKLDYLKSLENIPDAYLLSAVIYKKLDKPKRVHKSMLQASFHYHGGISAFEWLGIHSYERDAVTKATRYFLEAFSNYLVSCVSVNYIISIYSKLGDDAKTRAFIETVSSKSAITTDVACSANLKGGLHFFIKAKETLDYHRALERFRKVTDFSFERKIIEMVADSLGYFGMHGSAAEFYLMCHAENDTLHVYPSVLFGAETKMIKGKGFRYLTVARNVASKARDSPLALFTYGCALFDRAAASYSVNNHRHCTFLCQQAVLVLSRCIALYAEFATFWISLGNVLFTVSSLHSDSSSVYVPSWLISREGQTRTMVLVKKHESFVLALRCYAIAQKKCETEEMRKLVAFYIGLSFRYCKTFYKEPSDRMLCWGLSFALDSCDSQCWQRNNLCGVILTGLDEYRDALEFFKDSMLIGAREDARDAEFNLGIVYLRLGEFTKAHEVFMHRRGNDPMDSLVWRSYMLLHHCLDDSATVLHYLWYLICSIRHYPTIEQGMEYLRLISNSSSVTNAKVDELKKKCLLYAIFHNPMFMKLTFVGDTEVPHKLHDVTAYNYFYHAKFHAAQGNHSASEENLLEFLKLAATSDCALESDVNQSLSTLAMYDSIKQTSQATGGMPLTERLVAELPHLGPYSDQVLMTLFDTFKLTDISLLPPAQRNLYLNFVSKTLLRLLVGIPARVQFQPPPCRPGTLEEIIKDILDACGTDGKSSVFSDLVVSILNEELVNNQLHL